MAFEKNPSPSEIKEILEMKKTIAVVGLSDNPTRKSNQVAQVMQNAGYKIIPVNPTIDSALGQKAYASLKDIPMQVDIVNVFRLSEFLPEVAKETVDIGADIFWAQLGIANEEAYEYLKQHNVTVVMDRCIKVEYSRI